jgi:hypothetical protein
MTTITIRLTSNGAQLAVAAPLAEAAMALTQVSLLLPGVRLANAVCGGQDAADSAGLGARSSSG